MYKEKVGLVTEEDKNSILLLHERRIALKELLMTLDNQSLSENSKNDLYERIVSDTGKTTMVYEKWWADMAHKYNWKSVEGGNWNIDFVTNEIILVHS